MRGVILLPDTTLITPPTREPVDLEEVKKALGGGTADTDDTLLDSYVMASRELFERRTQRQLMSATWELVLDAFPSGSWIELPYPPLQSVTSVQYVDGDGVVQTMPTSDYVVKAYAGPKPSYGYLRLGYGKSWPTTRCELGAVRIRFVAGYGDATGDVPDLIKSALYLLVQNFHCAGCSSEKPHPQPQIGIDAIVDGFTLGPMKPLWRDTLDPTWWGYPSWLA